VLPVIDAAAVHAALDWPALVAALRDAFAVGAEAPVRHHHEVPRPGDAPATLLLMPAWQPGGDTGVKLVHVCPGNETQGLPSVQGIYVLFDGRTGTPRAVLDGTALTLRRTAAASALAASYLARTDSSHLLMIGAGALAPHLVLAHASVRPIEKVSLWNRALGRAQTLAKQLASEHFNVVVVDDLEAAIPEADIVSCATMSQEALVRGAWLRPGTHVDLVGAFRPDMRESDDEVMRRGIVFVDTMAGAMAEAGDILQPVASGALRQEAIVADLAKLCRGQHPGRRGASEITVFKSCGAALEDLAAARLVVERLATP
jgi:alanine dehydrogenase